MFILKTPKNSVQKLWFLVLFLNTTKSIRGATSNGPTIDEFHLKLFPNCGHLPNTPTSPPKIAASRIINSKEAIVHYPWVVMVLQYYKGKKIGRCGGTIITSR